MKTRIRTEFLLPFREVLAMLPGVKPKEASAFLRNAHDELLEALVRNDDEPVATISGINLSPGDFAEVLSGSRSRYRTTPKGAEILLALYEAGALPVRKTKPDGCSSLSELRRYAACEEDLQARSEAIEAEERAAAERRLAIVENPDLLAHEDFSYEILNDIFFRKCGPGSHKLRIGGIDVTKSVATLSSNSGKSRDSSVRFSWTGNDGELHSIDKQSRFAGNRTNDASRNWGLGRE